TDTKQADRPEYDLVFSARQARSLRPAGTPSRGRWRTFTFDGTGHNGYTDADVRVRFHLSARGLSPFRGPAADLSQPALPIRAAHDPVPVGDLLRARGVRRPERRADPLRTRVHPRHLRGEACLPEGERALRRLRLRRRGVVCDAGALEGRERDRRRLPRAEGV